MSEIKENKNIVVDNGSSIIKAGFSKEDFPSVLVPSIVGYPKN